MEKFLRMAELKAEAESLLREICEHGVNLVWGEGDLDSALVIVGEAPGADEDRLGRPYVGRAGLFLDEELRSAGLERSRIYITNSVKCRTVSVKGGKWTNRTPSAREVDFWRDTLMKELEIVHPRIILCLGSVAARAVIHKRFAIHVERGMWFEGPFGSHVMATFHPSYVSRSGYRKDSIVQKQFRCDLQTITAELHNV